MQDISIGPIAWMDSYSPPKTKGLGQNGSFKPVAVVEPARRLVLIPERIAKHRGVDCGQIIRSVVPGKPGGEMKWARWTVFGNFVEGHFRRTDRYSGQQFYPRRSRRSDDDEGREIAEVSLSHDGNYATATCLASKRPHAVGAQKDFLDDSAGAFYRHALLDDGHGEPIHEPIWGDEGWVTPLMREQYMWRRGPYG